MRAVATASPLSFAQRLAIVPLLPVAAAATLGLVLDHYLGVPLPISLSTIVACILVWIATWRQSTTGGAIFVYLGLASAAVAAAYHHLYVNSVPADDISFRATDERQLARFRGVLGDEPVAHRRRQNDPLVSVERADYTVATLEVRAFQEGVDWMPTTGRARLMVEGTLEGLHVGDEIEVLGWLSRPQPPLNPGEWDHAEHLQADRIRAEIHVRKSQEGVVRLGEGWRSSVSGWLAALHGWAQRTLQNALPPDESPVAMALLLGEGSPMTQADWDQYVRTGVIHVLAISGQHLVILGAFAWIVLRAFGLRRRNSALLVGLGLLGYALLTGGRPSAMRAAVMVCTLCVAILFGRRALPANTFALAWLVVLAWNPTDLFTQGFQLSFLAVAVLLWGIPRWLPRPPPDQLERLINESRPLPVRLLRRLGRTILEWYLVTFILGLVSAPLIVYWQNLVSPAGLLIGPPAILLTAIALVAGFLLLITEALGGLLSAPFAWITGTSLSWCDGMVRLADQMPGGCWYVGGIPDWWIVGFYALLIAWLAAPYLVGLPPRRFVFDSSTASPVIPWLRWKAPAVLAAWLCVGLVGGAARSTSDELRVTFLAVGHGGCTVIETPGGRCLLYDAGALAGPDVTRRQVAPFLWSRGIRRIDELFVSHADLDHFNGLPQLFDRFAIGQITLTPSFADKRAPGVAFALAEIERHGIPVRVVRAGDRLTADEVELEVLHPPSFGPDGLENVRSMVLLIRHRGHSILLTGDLEKEGLEQVLALPRRPIDVLMSPHHGSRVANTPRLLEWARPKLAIASQGPPRYPAREPDVYEQAKVPQWRTVEHGAITLHSHATGLVAETYRSHQRIVVRMGASNGP
jgi:competence protein ComEC